MDPFTMMLMNLGLQVGGSFLSDALSDDKDKEPSGESSSGGGGFNLGNFLGPGKMGLGSILSNLLGGGGSQQSPSQQWFMRQSVPPDMEDRYSEILQTILANKPKFSRTDNLLRRY